MKTYPLEPFSIGEDTYCVISKGHHDVHEFMKAVRKAYDWPLGMPEHLWMKTMPAPKDSGYSCWYEPVPEGTRGAWPCTYVREAYHEDSYEAKATALSKFIGESTIFPALDAGEQERLKEQCELMWQ